MPKDIVISVRISDEIMEKIEELAKERGKKPSSLVYDVLEKEFGKERAKFRCDRCGKEIRPKETYVCTTINKEHYIKKKAGKEEEIEIEVEDSIIEDIFCMQCATKVGLVKRFG
ncbi:MAG: ribbon-helix-helix protein, CopG family [Candidatus Diapherotrites archaeon]|nr:ribbon-helix-helix protein, CopG family [Candidatus Diapherotrites archaeon]